MSRRIVSALAWAACAAYAAAVTASLLFGLHLQTVLSDSMQPTYSAGDVVVTHDVASASLEVGDIPVFGRPDTGVQTAHRIVEMSTERDSLVLVTKGDASAPTDPPAVLDAEKVPVVVAVVPAIGHVLNLLGPETRVALIIALGSLLRLVALRPSFRFATRPAPTKEHP